jgi:hypothetical protein
MSGEQAERFRDLLKRYTEWRNQRKRSSERSAAIAHELWPLLRRFHSLFPVRIVHHKYDGLGTVADLYRILCDALKVEPLADPDARRGEVRSLCRSVPGKDMAAWALEYDLCRRATWSVDDVWATLVSLIRDVYCLEPTFEVSVESVLRDERPA